MSYPLDKKLVIAVSSIAFFDMQESDAILNKMEKMLIGNINRRI